MGTGEGSGRYSRFIGRWILLTFGNYFWCFLQFFCSWRSCITAFPDFIETQRKNMSDVATGHWVTAGHTEAPVQSVHCRCTEIYSFLVLAGGASGDTSFTPWNKVVLILCHDEAREVFIATLAAFGNGTKWEKVGGEKRCFWRSKLRFWEPLWTYPNFVYLAFHQNAAMF